MEAVERPGRAFQTLSMACYPYVVKCSSDEDESVGGTVRSIGPENFSWSDENGDHDVNGKVLLTNLKGYAMDKMAYRSMCCVFNVKPRVVKNGSDFPFDWEVTFNNCFLPDDMIQDNLEEFYTNIDIPLKCQSANMGEK